MTWMKAHWRVVCWPLAIALAAASGWWAAVEPGDEAYWVGGLLALPALVLGMLELERAWPSMTRTRKSLLLAVGIVCATVGVVYALVRPGAQSYLIGGLLTSPLMVVLTPILLRDAEDDEDYPAPTAGPWGPPAP